MPRPEKVQAVADIKERIEGAQAVFLAEYAGLSVKDQQELRRSLRENGAEFKVVKMSMARLAAAELDITTLDELLLGPTGIAYADGDPAGAAKVLRDFAKTHEAFVVKGGLLGLEFLPPEKIAELADLEPREVILAKLAGVMQAPMANLVGLLAALPRNTASVLQQLLERKESAEPEPATKDAPSSEVTEAADESGSEHGDVPEVSDETAQDADVEADAATSDDGAQENTKTEETAASDDAGDGSDNDSADAGADDKDGSSAGADDEE